MTPAEDAGLREFISEELQKVHDRVDQVHTQVDKIHDRVDKIHTRVDQVYAGQLDFQEHVAGHFGTVYARLSRVETQFEEMRGDFRAFGEGLGSTNRRMEELRSDMNRGFEELREETRAGFRSWGERVVALEDRVEGLEERGGSLR